MSKLDRLSRWYDDRVMRNDPNLPMLSFWREVAWYVFVMLPMTAVLSPLLVPHWIGRAREEHNRLLKK